jgi:hypothetical protein
MITKFTATRGTQFASLSGIVPYRFSYPLDIVFAECIRDIATAMRMITINAAKLPFIRRAGLAAIAVAFTFGRADRRGAAVTNGASM